jgi:hypothetical protein
MPILIAVFSQTRGSPACRVRKSALLFVAMPCWWQAYQYLQRGEEIEYGYQIRPI